MTVLELIVVEKNDIERLWVNTLIIFVSVIILPEEWEFLDCCFEDFSFVLSKLLGFVGDTSFDNN